ncbi:MAG: MotA/TolQ/ExbB proton channel family protein [Desulfobacterales bacterium]|jgi:biopolymer transport protein ExbB
MPLIEIFHKGGVLMIPITLCSIFALGIILERLVCYSRAKGNIKKLTKKLEPLVVGNKLSEAGVLCEETRGFISRLFLVTLQELQKESHFNRPIEEEMNLTRRVMDEELQVTILPALEKRLNALDTLARGTPLLGLLGTVIGMIKVFFTLGIGQSAPDPAVLAKGIGLALITTAAGLIVAIPSFFMHSYFQGRIDYLLTEAQKGKSWMMGQLAKRRLISVGDEHER